MKEKIPPLVVATYLEMLCSMRLYLGGLHKKRCYQILNSWKSIYYLATLGLIEPPSLFFSSFFNKNDDSIGLKAS
jgi:hypothetical protein